MRTIIIKTGCLFLLLFMMGAGCEKELCQTSFCPDDYDVIKSLSSAVGIVGYNKTMNKYFIQIHVENTIDEIITVYPCCELPEEFKALNLKVEVTGELFRDNNLPTPELGGQEVYYMNIKTITSL